MAYVDSHFPVQLTIEKFGEVISNFGWQNTLNFRCVAPASGGLTKRFARVALFKSVGSDGLNRNFGLIHAYGGKTPTPFGQEEVITHNSVLGIMDQVAETNQYKFRVAPILEAFLHVYVDGVEKSIGTDFTLDNDKRGITFTSAQTGVVTATYGVADDAPDMPSMLWFFTYEDVVTERLCTDITLTSAGSGVYNFPSYVEAIKQGAIVVKVAGVVVDSTLYTVDYATPKVTFTEAPSGTVTADFVVPISKNGTELADISVPSLNINSGADVAEVVYSSLRFINPSIPTAVTFIDSYTKAWSRDSELFYWGNITKDRIVMFFRIDPSPDPVNAYYAPLYIGKITTLGKVPKLNNVILGGCGTNSGELISSSVPLVINGKALDYGSNTTNGNDGIQLQQTIGGAYYQKHYLAFITHDVKADLSPESRYNPSVYTGKYHISPVYIVHPNDGYVGLLDEVYAVHPKNISQLDELEVKEKAVNELIGIGDGVRRVFHLRHTPKKGSTPVITVDCEAVQFTIMDDPADDAEVDATNDNQVKTVEFATAPKAGAEIYASYDYEQTYVFTLATTPATPFWNEDVCPYTPIGLAVLKKNEPFPE